MRRVVTLVVVAVAAVLIVAAAVLILRGRTGGADVYHVTVRTRCPGIRAITCTIVHSPGPGADTAAYSEPSKRDPSTGEWGGGCSWSRPS
jgi:hypothetical protein